MLKNIHCKEHPNAPVKHFWDEGHFILNGYPTGEGIKSNHKFECSECRKELKYEIQKSQQKPN